MKHFVTRPDGLFAWASCLRKERYSTRNRANKIKHRIQKKVKKFLNVYECSLCGGWHLTKKERGDEHRSK